MKTKLRIPLLKKLLEQFGIEGERVRLDWVSASEGDHFAALVDEMTEQIRQLGPLSNGHKESKIDVQALEREGASLTVQP